VLRLIRLTGLLAWPAVVSAQDAQDLAKQLANPVAALISVPFNLNDDWNIISRTILPLVSQSDIFPGAGPVLLLATGSDELLTADQWAAGPAGVALKQQGTG
jgi:hypothetical protein